VDLLSSSVGAVIRDRRLAAGLTQRDLAQRAGVSLRTVRNVELDRIAWPRAQSLRGLAAALGLTGADLGDLRGPGQSAPRPERGLRISVLGPLQVHWGARVIDVWSLKIRCLLGLLAIQPGQAVSREEIVDVLWKGHPPATWQGLVHTYVAKLRALLDPERADRAQSGVRPQAVTRAPGGYRLGLDEDRLDLARFDDLARQARSTALRERCQHLYAQALACWRGPLLADLRADLGQHPAAVAVSQRRLDAALAYADVSLERGQPEQAVARLQEIVAEEPLTEALCARLMLALAGAGRQSAALHLFEDVRARLGEHLGVEPGAQIMTAHLRVLRQDVPARGVTRR
jgi:DNA-binding SARP family transcriptional activator/DNA-binding XRE family transcriptional regulator